MTKKRSKPTPALVPAGKLAGSAERRSRGRERSDETLFPVPPPVAESPSGYARTLHELKRRIEQTRLATVIAANTAPCGRGLHGRSASHHKCASA